MFWGITLESGKKYTQILQKSFCVTMAALGFENPSNDRVFVVAEVNQSQHVLCSLQSGKLPQQVLNLNFTEGEQVSFFIEGEGVVHLTGFLTPEDNDSDSDSSFDEDEKAEPKSDIHLQNKPVNGAPPNHIQQNGVNDEKVSEVSWQGILSGSKESIEDEKETVMCNGMADTEQVNVNKDSIVNNRESEGTPASEKELEADLNTMMDNTKSIKDPLVINSKEDTTDKKPSNNNISENRLCNNTSMKELKERSNDNSQENSNNNSQENSNNNSQEISNENNKSKENSNENSLENSNDRSRKKPNDKSSNDKLIDNNTGSSSSNEQKVRESSSDSDVEQRPPLSAHKTRTKRIVASKQERARRLKTMRRRVSDGKVKTK